MVTKANWGARTGLFAYGPDQGPPISLQPESGGFQVAFVTTPDYGNYNYFVSSMAMGGGWGANTQVAANLRAPIALELSVDDKGRRYVTSCDNQNNARVMSDQGGNWKTTPLNLPFCAGELDALVAAGRLYVAYREKNNLLTLASFDATLF